MNANVTKQKLSDGELVIGSFVYVPWIRKMLKREFFFERTHPCVFRRFASY